jgi:hypothetical protein
MGEILENGQCLPTSNKVWVTAVIFFNEGCFMADHTIYLLSVM